MKHPSSSFKGNSYGQISVAKAVIVFAINYLFIVVLYNASFLLRFLNVSLDFSYERVYFLTSIFHFVLALYLLSKFKMNLNLFLICIAVPVLNDNLTYINGPNLVPLRAPIATIFPILGTALAFIYKGYSRKIFGLALVLSIAFLLVVNYYVVPMAREYMMAKRTPVVSKSIANRMFKTVDGTWIRFDDTAHAAVRLVECYFVGCPPCEDKADMLRKLRKNTSASSVDIVMICAGKASKWEKFVQHAAKNVTPGITYLYDANNALDSITNKPIPGFPMEFLYLGRDANPIGTLGYDAEDSSSIYQKKLNQINSWLSK